jgi:hypothetical protein
MTAEIVHLTPLVSHGNGARQALIAIAESLPCTDEMAANSWTDWLLAELWDRGFKVVPLVPRDG